jgi:hypothetical protein
MSEDWILDDTNSYRYVRNNPVNLTDPSGLYPPPLRTPPGRGGRTGRGNRGYRLEPNQRRPVEEQYVPPPGPYRSWSEWRFHHSWRSLNRNPKYPPTEQQALQSLRETRCAMRNARFTVNAAADQARRAGVPESEIEAIRTQRFVTRPGSRFDYSRAIARQLQSAAERVQRQGGSGNMNS